MKHKGLSEYMFYCRKHYNPSWVWFSKYAVVDEIKELCKAIHGLIYAILIGLFDYVINVISGLYQVAIMMLRIAMLPIALSYGYNRFRKHVNKYQQERAGE